MSEPRYMVVWTLKRGILLPPEPISEQDQAIIDYRARVEESKKAHAIHWNENFAPRRREVA